MLPAFEPADLPAHAGELRRQVRDFLDAERRAGSWDAPECSGWMVFNRGFSRRCAEAGLIGMTWPKAYGGGGRTAMERHVVIEELIASGAPLGAHWISDRQSGPQILAHGSEELRMTILPGICRGDIAFAIGMSEPDAGSDLAALRSRAREVPGGWRLNGRKIWTTNGMQADCMIGLFRTADAADAGRHAGLTQFVVDLTSEGVTRRPIRDMPGRDEFAEITLDDVFVPATHVLGEPGKGWQLVTAELANERSGPDRFLSVLPLLEAVFAELRHRPGAIPPADLGRMLCRIALLREVSASIAQQVGRGEASGLGAAMSKHLGNALEREIPETLRRWGGLVPVSGGTAADELLRAVMLAAPSYTLRGGTPEILRGIIARGLGLRR